MNTIASWLCTDDYCSTEKDTMHNYITNIQAYTQLCVCVSVCVCVCVSVCMCVECVCVY